MPRKQQDLANFDPKNLPMKTEPRCNVCQSPQRGKVDKLIAAQFSMTDIATELIDSDPDFKDKNPDTVRKNVERHAKRHLDLRNKAIRQMVEARAREQGMLLETVEGKITSGRALLDLLIMRATEQASDPDQRVKFADAIEAVKMLEDVQKAEFQHQLETYQKQVWAISEAIKTMVEQFKVEPLFLPAVVKEANRLFELETVSPQLDKAVKS